MNALRKNLPPLPDNIKRLPVDDRGYPVPAFVLWIDGKPDFRVVDPRHVVRCVNGKRCWVCGGPMGRNLAFVIGPMCAVNRVSSEPPSHRECAEFSARACPFLSLPKSQRRDAPPGEWAPVPGVAIERNPGVTLVWITRSYKPFRVPAQTGAAPGVLFEIGEPIECLWFAEGRAATRTEVLLSIETGLPALQQHATSAADQADLGKLVHRAMALIPE